MHTYDVDTENHIQYSHHPEVRACGRILHAILAQHQSKYTYAHIIYTDIHGLVDTEHETHPLMLCHQISFLFIIRSLPLSGSSLLHVEMYIRTLYAFITIIISIVFCNRFCLLGR